MEEEPADWEEIKIAGGKSRKCRVFEATGRKGVKQEVSISIVTKLTQSTRTKKYLVEQKVSKRTNSGGHLVSRSGRSRIQIGMEFGINRR